MISTIHVIIFIVGEFTCAIVQKRTGDSHFENGN